MLNPSDRTLLLEALRPPDGYTLDRAVGTSYSLDLLALLTAPLAFTFFDWEDKDGRPTGDPLALLEAVRRNAEKIHLFCQAGEVKVPPPGRHLLAYLERSLIEVKARHAEGVFHPKLWCLRYVADDLPVKYRLLCLTRNLTFDHSWDTALVLNGELTTRQKGFTANRPLGEFITELPRLAIRPVDPAVENAVQSMGEEVRRVAFDLPPDIEDIAFWPLGLNSRQQRPFPSDIGRALVMSPFVSMELLSELVEGVSGCVLISRPDQLAELPRELLDNIDVYAVDPAFDELADPTEDTEQVRLAGLHAKLFVIDQGWNSRIYTGSANATNAAFGRNVEFIVELVGKKSKIGIAALLDSDRDARGSFSSLLRRWCPPEDFDRPDVSAQRALDRALARARRAIALAALHLQAEPDGAGYNLSLVAAEGLRLDPGVTVRCWPATLQDELGVQVRAWQGTVATFPSIPLRALSGFMAFEAATSFEGTQGTTRFVANLPLNGAPEDRLERLLAAMLSDKDQVRRLFWLLLEGQHEAIVGAFQEDAFEGPGVNRSRPLDSYPLFEQMVGALADDPARLREIGRLIEDLAKTAEGSAVLPGGVLALWESLKGVMERDDG